MKFETFYSIILVHSFMVRRVYIEIDHPSLLIIFKLKMMSIWKIYKIWILINLTIYNLEIPKNIFKCYLYF